MWFRAFEIVLGLTMWACDSQVGLLWILLFWVLPILGKLQAKIQFMSAGVVRGRWVPPGIFFTWVLWGVTPRLKSRRRSAFWRFNLWSHISQMLEVELNSARTSMTLHGTQESNTSYSQDFTHASFKALILSQNRHVLVVKQNVSTRSKPVRRHYWQ